MKATGIVRRIDAGVIITPKPINPHKHWFFADFCPTKFAKNPVLIVFTIKKARCSLHIMMPDERYVHPVLFICIISNVGKNLANRYS